MEWKEVKIKDVGQIVTGNTPPRSKPEYYGSHTLFIKATDIGIDKKYCVNPEEAYSNIAYKKYKNSLIPKNSVCVVTIGTIGKKIILSHQDLFINQAMNAIIPNDKNDGEFLYYSMKFNLPQLSMLDSGTASGRENVSKSSFSNIKLRIPSLPTQKKIAQILSTYDDLIENNNRRIELLEKTAQNIYKEWFIRFRFPGYKKTKFINGLPEGWEMKKLGEFVEIKKGKNITKSTITHGKVPVVAGGLEPAYYHNNSNTKSPTITISASGANAGYVNFYYENIWASDCSFIDTNATNYIFYIYLFLKNKQKEIFHLQKGSAQPHVYPKDLSSLSFIKPPFEEIKKAELMFSNIFNEIKILKTKNQKLRIARNRLLPKLISGKLSVEHLIQKQTSKK